MIYWTVKNYEIVQNSCQIYFLSVDSKPFNLQGHAAGLKGQKKVIMLTQ